MPSIESVQRRRPTDDLTAVDAPATAAPAPPQREAADLEYMIAYPKGLFVPLADAPKPRVPSVLVPGAPKPFTPPGTSMAPRKVDPPPAGPVHTTSANEVTTYNTAPPFQDVIGFVKTKWPQLTEQGARTLAAQFIAETSASKNCYNWNIGNLKAGPNEPHMYLKGVWEVTTSEAAATHVAASKGQAHIATTKEIADNKWPPPGDGKAIVVFDPPHERARFRSFPSFEDGAALWLAKHQAIASKNSTYLDSINRADTAAVAHALKQNGYYTTNESDYAAAMKGAKAEIDKELGAP